MFEFKLYIEKMSSGSWSDLLADFDDASIYQSWSYGDVRWGSDNLCHAVFKHGDDIVAIAQVLIKNLPILPFGVVAYIP